MLSQAALDEIEQECTKYPAERRQSALLAALRIAQDEHRWLSNEIRILNDTRALVAPRVRHGLVVDELLMEALDGDCDLIVIGAHRQNGWQRFLLDDLSHQIIIRADRPILVV